LAESLLLAQDAEAITELFANIFHIRIIHCWL
jgi:hypothetical protein